MKERPILFSTPMVQVLPPDGIKEQTRRTKGLNFINQGPDDWEFIGDSRTHDVPNPVCKGSNDLPWYQWSGVINNSHTFIAQCPYGLHIHVVTGRHFGFVTVLK